MRHRSCLRLTGGFPPLGHHFGEVMTQPKGAGARTARSVSTPVGSFHRSCQTSLQPLAPRLRSGSPVLRLGVFGHETRSSARSDRSSRSCISLSMMGGLPCPPSRPNVWPSGPPSVLYVSQAVAKERIQIHGTAKVTSGDTIHSLSNLSGANFPAWAGMSTSRAMPHKVSRAKNTAAP